MSVMELIFIFFCLDVKLLRRTFRGNGPYQSFVVFAPSCELSRPAGRLGTDTPSGDRHPVWVTDTPSGDRHPVRGDRHPVPRPWGQTPSVGTDTPSVGTDTPSVRDRHPVRGGQTPRPWGLTPSVGTDTPSVGDRHLPPLSAPCSDRIYRIHRITRKRGPHQWIPCRWSVER